MGFCYRVDLTRNVSCPEFGPFAYHSETKRKEFQFGKGKEFKNGKAAAQAAENFAKNMMDKASVVSVWRMAGGSGTGRYLKDDRESRFAIGWDESHNPT